ncbi:MAG: Mrp/NBP35 family ATP-binding protein [Erysipelotrichaceae bacterium]|nr:Mrp/NBP35 family ATP-binding protein [Erysipelotrichaceae bacterium]
MSCEGCASRGNCSKQKSGGCSLTMNPHNTIKRIVGVMSGKGGVGKSTVSVMLAKAMADQGLKVGIMDADITGPSIPRLMGLENEKAFANTEGEILPVSGDDGIKIMSLNYLLPDENDPVVWRGPVITGVLKQFFSDVYWGELDVLFIDMPPGTGDVALTILQEFPVSGVVMVSTPQPMVSMIVTKAIRMCRLMNIKVYGVVENMAYLNCPNCSEKIMFYNEDELNEFIASNEVKLYGTLPQADLIRNVNVYDSFNLKQQEELKSYFSQIACELEKDMDLRSGANA